jgi:hypothetical protein
MVLGNRETRSSARTQRKSEAFRPRGETLEPKVLLALLQLGAGTPQNISTTATTPPAGPQTIGGQLPFIADSSGFNPQVQGTMTTDPGLGVLETNSVNSQGAGFSVAALGDMNGDGSNDFAIGAPNVTQSGTVISLATSATNPSEAFLLLGNRSASIPTAQSWLSSTPEQRVGNIANLSNSSPTGQPSPFTGRSTINGTQYSYNFAGITFETLSDPTSGLGAFVAAAGPNWFVIGAPNYTGGGRLYYIQATTAFNSLISTTPINLDTPTAYPNLTIVTFEDTANPTSGLGSSFADVPNVFGDGTDDLVIGEPTASLNGKTGNGGIFIFPNTSLPLVLGANNVVQVQAQSPFTLSGANSGDQAGFSVANAGDVNGATLSGANVNDLLIGAPKFNNGAGAAYLVYGGTTLTSGRLNGIVDLSRLQITPIPTGSNADPTPPQGAVFVGAGTDMAGSTVSGAGVFNPGASKLSDFMIGSPLGNGQAGRVNLFYGASTGAINSTGQYTAGLIANATNPIQLNNPTAALALTGVAPVSASFVGAGGAFRAGTSISYYNTSAASVIIVGVPNDSTQGGLGSVYEVQGPTSGTFQTQLQPLNSSIARQYTITYPTTFSSTNPINFGISVSAFADGNGDLIAGGPGYTGTLPTTNNGTTSPPTPLVGAAAVAINSLQPANTLIPLGGSPTPTPTPTPGIGSGAVSGAVLPGTFHPTTFIAPFGTSFTPTVSALSAFTGYAPIPLSVALQQYLPPDGFIQRILAYAHPGQPLPPTLQNRGQTHSFKTFGSQGVWTLGSKVFTRGRFHPGKTYEWSHESLHNNYLGRVVPASSLREKYTSKGNPLGKV